MLKDRNRKDCRSIGNVLITLLGILFVLGGVRIAAADELYSISPRDPLLKIIDSNVGSTLSSVAITLAGEVVKGANALARHPGTGDLWVVIKVQRKTPGGQPVRVLAKIDPLTGVATRIGEPADALANIAFDSNGTLFGMTGGFFRGGEPPFFEFESPKSTLFVLSQSPDQEVGTRTEFLNLLISPSSGGGQAIAHNPDDGKLYHATGCCGVPSRMVFESIDLATKVRTEIPLSGDVYLEATAFMYAGSGRFLLASLSTEVVEGFPNIGALFSVTTDGEVTFITEAGSTMKGLVPVLGIGGTVTRISPTIMMVKCHNRTNEQKVRFELPPDATSWDCEAEGLLVFPGDDIQMSMKIEGIADGS